MLDCVSFAGLVPVLSGVAMPTDLQCPRCGYDMRAATNRWTDVCPLNGTCSECGLVFRWGPVMRPDLHGPAWWVETVPSRRNVFRTLAGTFVRVALPPLFWRSIEMAFPLRSWRLLRAWLVTILLLIVVSYGGLLGYARHTRLLYAVPRPTTPVPRGIMPQGIAQLRVAAPTFSHSVIETVYETAVSPLRKKSNITMTWPVATGAWYYERPYTPRPVVQSYLPPAELVKRLVRPVRPWSGFRRDPIAEALELFEVWGLALFVVPLLFLLLPRSCRVARVRPAHLLRAAVTGGWFVLTVAGLSVVITLVADAMGKAGFGERLPALMGWVLPVWMTWFWATTIHTYLRMRHAWSVAVALQLAAVLIVLLGFYLRGDAEWIFGWYLNELTYQWTE